jgi:predicted dehydrogenase
VLLATAQNRRFLPAYRQLRDFVRCGKLGEVRQVIGNYSWGKASYAADSWRLNPAESPAGGMAGLGIHIADAMMGLGLRGRSVGVIVRGDHPEHPHTVTAAIEFDGGPVGILTTVGGAGTPWRIEVHGSEGYAAMDGETRLVHGRAGAPETRIDFGAFDKERAELEAFAEAVQAGAPWPVTRDEGCWPLSRFSRRSAAVLRHRARRWRSIGGGVRRTRLERGRAVA